MPPATTATNLTRYFGPLCAIWVTLMLASTARARTMSVHVIDDQTARPVAQARVEMGPGKNAVSVVTGADGVAVFALPDGEETFQSLSAQAAGYVCTKQFWLEQRIAPLPDSCTMRLRRGVEIGGIVTDEAGKPLADARVRANIQNILTNMVPDVGSNTLLTAPMEPVPTDAQGHWKILAPTLSRLGFWIEHPKYYAEYTAISPPDAATLTQLREGRLPIIMKPGAHLSGRILDAEGHPLPHAQIWIEPGGEQAPVEAHADADGEFSAPATKPGKVVAFIAAPGHRLTQRPLDLPVGVTQTDFTLEPGNRLHGTVVTSAGTPIPNAWMVTTQWHGGWQIFWDVHTDAAGTFGWDGAPDDEVVLGVQAPGMFPRFDVKVRAGDAEQKITLQPTLCIRGKVIDAQTGWIIEQPVHVTPGEIPGEGKNPYFAGENRATYLAGQFAAWILREHAPTCLQVAADGYLPEVVGPFETGRDYPAIEVKLTKAASTSVTVRTPSGKPAAGAAVAFVTSGKSLDLYNGDVQGGFDQWTRTDEQGVFVLQPHRKPGWIWISHPEGYAWAPEKEMGAGIALTPWASVQGAVYADTKIIPGALLNFTWKPSPPRLPGEPDREARYPNVWADDAGRFNLPRVMQGVLQAGRRTMAQQGDGKVTQFIQYPQSIRVNAGQAGDVVLGGMGVTINAKIAIPAGLKDWQATDSVLRREGPALPVPADFNQKTQAEQNAWLVNYWRTPVKTPPAVTDTDDSTEIPVELRPDGTLQTHDVTMGTYGLSITVRVPRLADDAWKPRPGLDFDPPGKPVGRIVRQVVITDEGRQVIDLGQLTLGPPQGVEVGDMAPDFSVPTLDGKVVTLSDLRGKWVLLDHWATWCGPCVAELPEIKKVCDEFAKDGQLVVVGAAWDDAQKVRTFTMDKHYSWTQCVVATGAKAQMEIYGSGIPQVYLIDPAGKIVAKNPPPEQMLERIKAMVNGK